MRGFHFFNFDRLTPTRAARLMAETAATGLPGAHPLLAEPFILRLTLHRTPRAPLALAVTLGAPFQIGVAKLERGTTEPGHLMVCDAPAVAIAPLTHRG